MAMMSIAAIFGLMLYALARRANVRFRSEKRLPMQWWVNGDVTWSAPRHLALAFIPALATAVLSIFAILSLTIRPRAGQETLVLPTMFGLGALFIGIQLVHFWLIAKTVRRNMD